MIVLYYVASLLKDFYQLIFFLPNKYLHTAVL